MKFSDLIIEPAVINEEAAAKLAAPFFKYIPEGEMIFTDKFQNLKDQEKIIKYLIGRLGLSFIKKDKEIEVGVTSKEIAERLKISYSSVRVYITLFRRKGWVITDKKGKKNKITIQAIADLNKNNLEKSKNECE